MSGLGTGTAWGHTEAGGDTVAKRTEPPVGVRRVQEVVTDPIALDGESEPIKVEDEAELPPLATATRTAREYVHSPGYVDEVVAQVDVSAAAGASHGADRPAWVIQDANSNLVGLVGDDGTLLHQYTWDPYGEPVAVERFDTGGAGSPQPFENRIGHQGLFFDRFDGQANNVLLPQLYVNPATGLAARGLYQVRNRTYDPFWARWTQRDPIAQGLPLPSGLCYSARAMRHSSQYPCAHTAYQDGMNLFGYVLSAPISRTDPTGLFTQFVIPQTTVLDIQTNWMDNVLSTGLTLKDMVAGALQDAALQMFDDAMWATDWTDHDAAYLGAGDHRVSQRRLRAHDRIMAGVWRHAGRYDSAFAGRLTKSDKKRLCDEARQSWRMFKGAQLGNKVIHHRVPLEWSHLMPGLPNRPNNLAAVNPGIHLQINQEWRLFKEGLGGRQPTAAQVQAQVSRIEQQFGWAMEYLR